MKCHYQMSLSSFKLTVKSIYRNADSVYLVFNHVME